MIENLPLTSAYSGVRLGMDPGWSMADELTLQQINQLILQRRMWLSKEDAHLLSPIEMSWHKTKPEIASKPQIAAFFGGSVNVVRGE